MTGFRDSELNQVQARPDNDDINLKFLRALPSSWSQVALALKTRGGLESMSFDDLYNKLRSLELDVRIGHSYGVKVAGAPTHSAFIGTACSGSKLSNFPLTAAYCFPNTVSVDQLEMEEMDLKWQMAMLSLRINRFEKKAGRKMNYNNQQPARFDRRKVRCYKCLQLGHFAREYHAAENKTDEVAKVYGMMAGLHADNSGAGISNAADEFAMMGISPKAYQHAVKTLESQKDWYHKTQMALEEKIRVLSANLENTTNTLSYTEKLHDQAQKEKKEWEVKTKIGLGFQEYFGVDEVFDLSTPSVFYSDPVEKEVKPLYSRFVKAGEMHAVPPPITGTYMPSPYQSDIEETQVSYGSKSDNKTSETISESNDFVSCDNSDKSSDSETHASCDSSLKTKTKDFPPAVDIQTLPESDVEDPNSTTGSPSFSCSENVKSPRIICNKRGMNNRNVCKNNFVRQYVPADSWNLPNHQLLLVDHDPAACRKQDQQSISADRIHILLGDLIQIMNGIVDSGCSKKYDRKKEKLDDFVQFKGRHVKFGGGDELQHFNLFSVSQICDKKNKVLFTDTDCLVLSEEFQLPDASQVLRRSGGMGYLSKGWHMDLFGPTNIRSIDQKYYSLVVTDDFSRFSWTFFLGTKDETFYVLKEFIALIENQLNKKVKGIRCDNGTEFKNAKLIELCGEKGIKRDYSNPRTPQQNGVAERKNRTLIEAARTMLADSKLPTMFWTEAVSTACYVLNRVSITNPHNKTPYELISGKVPQIGHLKPFGCQVTILNTSDHLGKFEGKADEGYLVGYAPNSKAYRVYNLTNKRVEETMNLRFLEDKPNVQGIGHEWYFDLDYLTDSLGYTRFKTDKPAGTQETNINAGTQDHDSDSEVDEQVIVVPSFPSNSFAGPSSSNGPSVMERNADYAEELAKLQRQEYEAKDAAARYGYLFSQETAEILSQAEAEIQNQGVSADRDPAGIDSAGGVSAGSTSAGSDPAGGNPAGSLQPAGSYEPTGKGNPAVSTSVSADFIPVHADESTLPPGQSLGSSENTTRFPVPSDVCKDQLSSGIFTSSSYDDDFSATLTNLAPAVEVNPVPTKRLVAQGQQQEEGHDYDEVFALVLERGNQTVLAFAFIWAFWVSITNPHNKTPYVAAKTKLKDEPDPPVNVHLYRSMIGSLMYLTASRPDIMFAVSACSRHQVTPLTSHLNAVKKIFKYLKGQPKLGLWYPKDSPFHLEAYGDSDYAGSHGDRKSTTGGCQFLCKRLISWQCKKQTIVTTSSTEAEYVTAASCCAQVLWIQNQLLDYGFNFMNTKIFIDNQSTICIVKNLVFHQRTKHIEIRHHFIRDANEKNLIQVLKIHTDNNVADLLTKAFDGPRFEYLVVHIGMVDMVLVSAGSTMILLVVILPAGCFVSAGSYGLC
ncbi:putative ribonuclease H-like domain-containing protein [Tanacetum coccineum]